MKILGEKGFLALPSPYSNFETAKIVIVPFDYAPDVARTKQAPQSIIKASHKVECFDESCMAAGDSLHGVLSGSLEKKLDRCERARTNGVATLIQPKENKEEIKEQWFSGIIRYIINCGKIPIILGGDHNLTPLSIEAIKCIFDDLVVLCFDSRLDLLSEDAKNYTRHRGVMRKILPQVDSIISVGFRSVKREEMRFAYENDDKIKRIMMRDQLRPLLNLQTAINKMLHYLKGKNVYVSFDVSFLDPSTLGHVSEISEPGGMTYDETLDIWKKILPEINVVGADFVEFCHQTQLSCNSASTYAFAKLITRFISRLNLEVEKEGE